MNRRVVQTNLVFCIKSRFGWISYKWNNGISGSDFFNKL